MLLRRSLRLRHRQQNSQNASMSTAIASSSADESSKSINKTAKKRVRLEPALESEDVIQPKRKKMKHDKHNFESFPTEILKKIFIETDDIGLLHLANTCTRFEAIAQTVFSKSYNDQYFIINDEKLGGDRELYAAQFDRFGNHIHAIEFNHIYFIGPDNWVMKILQPYLNRIKKLTFNECTLKSVIISSQPLDNITHLAFRSVFFVYDNEFDLPECNNLIEFEISDTWGYSRNSLQKFIRNNPKLHRLMIKDCDHIESETIDLIADHLYDIKELAMLDCDVPVLVSAVDRIANSFKCLEYFSINVAADLHEPLQRLAKECKNLKHLGLCYYVNRTDNDMIRSFRQIESLYLYDSDEFTPFDLPVEHLPSLCHLSVVLGHSIDEYEGHEFSDVLLLLQRGQSLQRITMNFTNENTLLYPGVFIDAKFFEKFIEAITIAGKSDAQLEVERDGQVIGYINVNGVVWRNKLMRWIGCDRNDTNIRLLDLAEHRDISDKAKNAADQTNLLDKICDYLDLGSLAKLAGINEPTERLVSNYVEKSAKKRKTFTYTGEFDLFEYLDDADACYILNKIKNARLITDLHVCIVYEINIVAIKKIIENCDHLDKLSIYGKCNYPFWSKVSTNLSHIVYDSPYSVGCWELMEIADQFEKVEEIECKNAGLFNGFKSDENNIEKFGNLQKFTFNYRSETQLKNLKKIFENTTVQLVPVYPDFA